MFIVLMFLLILYVMYVYGNPAPFDYSNHFHQSTGISNETLLVHQAIIFYLLSTH